MHNNKPSKQHWHSSEGTAPSLPLKPYTDAPFKPPALLLTGLKPRPQWWMRGIRKPSICMDKYLQMGSQVSSWQAFQTIDNDT